MPARLKFSIAVRKQGYDIGRWSLVTDVAPDDGAGEATLSGDKLECSANDAKVENDLQRRLQDLILPKSVFKTL